MCRSSFNCESVTLTASLHGSAVCTAADDRTIRVWSEPADDKHD